MRIAIDISRAVQPQRTGPGSYTFNLIQSLKKVIPENHQVVLLSDRLVSNELGKLPANWSIKVLNWIGLGKGWTAFRLPLHLWFNKYDLFFEPTAGLPFIISNIKKVITLHDVAFLQAPQVYAPNDLWRQRLVLKSAKRADKIITVSEYTKSLLINLAKLPAEKIFVTPLAPDLDLKQVVDLQKIEDVKKKYGITKQYFITASRVEIKKGIDEMVEALARLNRKDVELVILGSSGNQYEKIIELIAKKGLIDQVKILGWVERDDFATLMSGAIAYISACRYEGFGISVADAMQCGCPVVAYAAGAIPEVVEQSALLVDPCTVEELSLGMNTIINDSDLRSRLSKVGLERISNFSWDKTAKKTKIVVSD